MDLEDNNKLNKWNHKLLHLYKVTYRNKKYFPSCDAFCAVSFGFVVWKFKEITGVDYPNDASWYFCMAITLIGAFGRVYLLLHHVLDVLFGMGMSLLYQMGVLFLF